MQIPVWTVLRCQILCFVEHAHQASSMAIPYTKLLQWQFHLEQHYSADYQQRDNIGISTPLRSIATITCEYIRMLPFLNGERTDSRCSLHELESSGASKCIASTAWKSISRIAGAVVVTSEWWSKWQKDCVTAGNWCFPQRGNSKSLTKLSSDSWAQGTTRVGVFTETLS